MRNDVVEQYLAEETPTGIVTGQYSWSHEFKGRDAINNGLRMGHFRSFFAARPRTLAFNFIAEGDYVVVKRATTRSRNDENHHRRAWRIEGGEEPRRRSTNIARLALSASVLGAPATRSWRRRDAGALLH